MIRVEPVSVLVEQEHHIAQARQSAQVLCHELGFSRSATFQVATAVSELAANLYLHTPQGGTVTLRVVEGSAALEIQVEDAGPGIPDLELALTDGFSTRGGLGCGLSGARRLMDEFTITSRVGQGTLIVARKWLRP